MEYEVKYDYMARVWVTCNYCSCDSWWFVMSIVSANY